MPWFFGLHQTHEGDLREELKIALERCQERIEADAAANVKNRGMGTTLTMAYVLWPRLYVVHVGDSRCYLLRKPRLERITTDHTMAQQFVEKGMLPAEEAEVSRWSHVLWNCLGGDSHEVRPEVCKASLKLGDTILLCTDGLTRCVNDEELRDQLSQERTAEETCRQLVKTANQRGGPDNITVVVARCQDIQPNHVGALQEKAELPATEEIPAPASTHAKEKKELVGSPA
jgi:protein phosphatase